MTLIENEIKLIEENLNSMIDLVKDMHQKALFALSTGDRKLAIEIVKTDEQVNNLDEMINEQILSFLATQSPVAKDLRETLAIIRVSTDIERIGDYAKVIAQFVILDKPLYLPFKQNIDLMHDTFMTMFEEATTLFFNPVLEKTHEIARKDELIDGQLKTAFASIPEITNNTNVESVLNTFNIIRTIERAGDHTKNICESVIFRIKGKKIDLG
jgi:phosphate transport system protein